VFYDFLNRVVDRFNGVGPYTPPSGLCTGQTVLSANHVDDTHLDFGLGEHGGDGVGESGQPVNGGKEYISYPRKL
jgi:hypothetical protein